jgi:hypothetical protein
MLDLVKSVSVENLANQRAAVQVRIAEAMKLIDEAQAIASAANLGFPDLRHHQGYRSDYSLVSQAVSSLPDLMKTVDAGGWQWLMSESGLRTFMDAETRHKWDEGLTNGDAPDLTPANIAATFRTMYDNRGSMFEQGVVKAFKGLSWDYKTNLPQKFGKRLVMTYLCYAYGMNHNKTDQLDDLVRVLSVVDGKPEPDHRDGMYRVLSRTHSPQSGVKGWPKVAETDYMTVKLFKNGNGHITFKRLDMVDKLNAIIAKNFPGCLPAPK